MIQIHAQNHCQHFPNSEQLMQNYLTPTASLSFSTSVLKKSNSNFSLALTISRLSNH